MFVGCLILVVAGLIGGVDYAVAVLRGAALPVAFFAAFGAALAIAWRYSRAAGMVLYGVWLAAGAVLGVRSEDEQVIEALWGLALVSIIVVLTAYLLQLRKQGDGVVRPTRQSRTTAGTTDREAPTTRGRAPRDVGAARFEPLQSMVP